VFISIFPPEGNAMEEAGVPFLFLGTLLGWAICAGLYIAPLAIAKGAIARGAGRRVTQQRGGRRSWADVDAEEDHYDEDDRHERRQPQGEMD
ncbi:MAG TPA: hypothetical protein VKE94_06305, partial [Gemmataceae bacterium]|nr:hypothetical protein [Gemmataceae bacterium]